MRYLYYCELSYPCHSVLLYTYVTAQLVNVTQAHMSALYEKHSAIEAHNAAYQVADSMAAQQSILDSYGATMIEAVPTCASDMQTQQQNLDDSFSKTITLYRSGQP